MPEPLNSTVHSDVVPHLKQLLTLASEQWGTRITQRSVAVATGINYKTISEWANHKTTQYDLSRLSRLCWYFDTNSVLFYKPGSSPFLASQEFIGRSAKPTEPYPKRLLIRNMIPVKLAGVRIPEIMKATGLSRNAVVALKNQDKFLSRVRRTTLTALCDYLSTRKGHHIEVSELLVFERDWISDRGEQ